MTPRVVTKTVHTVAHDDNGIAYDLYEEVEETVEVVKATKVERPRRHVTSEQIKQYEGMIEMYIKKDVIKNWVTEAQMGKGQGDNILGNTGMSLDDIRQHLRTEVFIALRNYNPEFRNAKGQQAKESTFVFNHLRFRVGQLMKRLTKKGYGYGVWVNNIEEVLWETERE